MLTFSSSFMLMDVSDYTEGSIIKYNGIDYVSHSPIRINTNSDFDAAHGVVNWATGNGSSGNPWIIEGWDINGTDYGYCLYIGNTTDYFEVRGSNFHNADGVYSWPYYYASGLTLYNIINGKVIDNIAEFSYFIGIFAIYSEGIIVQKNTVRYNEWSNIYFYSSSKSMIINNTVSNSWRGIYTDYCEEINISYNYIFSHNYAGLWLGFSNCSTLIGNQMLNDGIDIGGHELSNWNTHNIDTSNMVNGKPVMYLRNQTGGTVPPGAGQVILANCSNIIIDKQNVSGGDTGIILGFSSNNTISNNTVEFNSYDGMSLYESDSNLIFNNSINYSLYMAAGINIYYCDNNTIRDNFLANNSRYGVLVQYSNDNRFVNNNISGSAYGMTTHFSERTLILNNTLSNNLGHIDIHISTGTIVSNNTITSGNERFEVSVPYGILFYNSEHCKADNNKFINSSLMIWGYELSNWNTHYIDTTNTVNGKPVIYWCNRTGGTIPPGAGGVILANCTNVTVYNQILNNGSVGLNLGFSDNNVVYNNTIEYNGNTGVNILSSDSNTFYNNSISYNQWPFWLDFPGAGSDFNLIYHNDFINNSKIPLDFTTTTYWHNGFPSGGNHWSDYTGIDVKTGVFQNQDGSDGFGDTPYWNDYYPLMKPFTYEFTNFNILLSEGWNLISTPLIQGDESIDKVLENITGKWDVVKYYDTLDKADPWKTYRPGSSVNDLTSIDNTMGFWINITEPNVNLTVSGYEPDSTIISLYAGWNLVGYPTQTTETVGNALWGTGADRVEVFDPVSPYIKEVGSTYIMKPGEGYWVHVPADTVWTVN